MTDPSHLPALPTAGPASLVPVSVPGEEPSKLWLLVARYRWPFLVASVVCAATAWAVGGAFGKPQWAVDGTLLYNPMPLPERHRGVVQLPTLRTYAGWVSDPAHLETICREFNIKGMTPDDFGARCVKVEQPYDTQTINIKVTYPVKEQGEAIANRLMELFINTVMLKRREAVLVQSLQTARQNLDQSQSEANRLGAYIAELDAMMAQGYMPQTDLDPNAVVRRGALLENIKKEQVSLAEQRTRYAHALKEQTEMEDLVRKSAYPRREFEKLGVEVRILRLKIDAQDELIKQLNTELRNLPVEVAKSKKAEQDAKARVFRQEAEQLEQALAKPGALPSALVAQGIDAREFTVRAAARGGDQPATSNRKSLALMTFFGLMAGAFGLAYAYDRAAAPVPVFGPSAAAAATPARLTRVVQVDRGRDGRPEKVTVAQVESDRMTVRIDRWIKGPASDAALLIGPDGRIEEPPHAEPAATDDDLSQMALRMHHWLGGGGHG